MVFLYELDVFLYELDVFLYELNVFLYELNVFLYELKGLWYEVKRASVRVEVTIYPLRRYRFCHLLSDIWLESHIAGQSEGGHPRVTPLKITPQKRLKLSKNHTGEVLELTGCP
jgi:hypothetical protein